MPNKPDQEDSIASAKDVEQCRFGSDNVRGAVILVCTYLGILSMIIQPLCGFPVTTVSVTISTTGYSTQPHV